MTNGVGVGGLVSVGGMTIGSTSLVLEDDKDGIGIISRPISTLSSSSIPSRSMIRACSGVGVTGLMVVERSTGGEVTSAESTTIPTAVGVWTMMTTGA